MRVLPIFCDMFDDPDTDLRAWLAGSDPSLRVTSLHRIGGGEHNVVYLVNDELVVRVARRVVDGAGPEWEAALLHAIAPRLPVDVPLPDVVEVRPDGALMTYRVLRGTPLTGVAEPGLLDAAVAGVSGFLRALHAVPLDSLPAGLRGTDPRAWWQELYDRVRERLLPRMGRRTAGETAARFDAFLTGPRPPRYVLIHGDLGSEHVLLDADSGAVTGVIDWSSANVDDPAVDYAAISTTGPAFVERLMAIDEDFAAGQIRAAFYRSTFGLQAWLHALDHGTSEDDAAFAMRYRE
jgi:aminoglycoside 2''-phosphotransferase